MPYDQSTFGTLLYGVKGVGIPIRYTNKSGGVGIFRGGGIKGLMPNTIIGKENDAAYEMTRITLREVWNNSLPSVIEKKDGTIVSLSSQTACTPFRQKMNAGDPLSRPNYSCGGSCQTPQSIPGIASIRNSIGAIYDRCDETRIPPSACNVKYVYDSSDYVTFLKNQATNRNYNDLSFGGDQSNATFQTVQAMRRF